MIAKFSGSPLKVKSLAGRIFISVLAFVLVTIIAVALVLTSVFYLFSAGEGEDNLMRQAREAAAMLQDAPDDQAEVDELRCQFDGEIRYTLINADGDVLFDSDADEGVMENHANRPEFVEARERGEALSVRFSSTLQTDTVYAAVLLDDGDVIRLSESRASLVAFMSSMVVPAIIITLVAAVLAFAVSRLLTKHIMKPIDALDFANPLENEIYEEMDPLLFRIDEQQRQLKQQNIELAQAESMRRDFSSNVSHEMKTPLQVISGYAELMKNDMVDPEDRRKFAGLIYDEAQAMRLLINDVLTLSRLDETTLQQTDAKPIDLAALARRVRMRLESFAAEKVVRVKVTGDPAYIMGNETMAEEMLYNLLENSIRYNRTGGEVHMAISREKPQPGNIFAEGGRLEAPHGVIVVCVSDTGRGIPEEYREKIFERFFRVDKSRSKNTGGTGLGLAIVKHTVLYHHGTIKVESEEGKGTTFTLRFAAVEPLEEDGR